MQTIVIHHELGQTSGTLRRRIVQLVASSERGGAEAIALECIAAAESGELCGTAVLAFADGPLLRNASALGASTLVLPPPSALSALGESFATRSKILRGVMLSAPALPRFVRELSAALSSLSPDLIHSHGIKTHVLAALVPKKAPVVWHLHDYVSMRPMSSRLLSLLSRRCALAVAVSNSVAEDARRWLPRSVALTVIHNPVDCDRFHPDGRALDLDHLSGLGPAPAGTVRIGLPATFARWKGQNLFLQALARLKGMPIRAYVIGAGVYRTERSQWSVSELRTIADRLSLTNLVGFTGAIDDMPACYRALDIVVHASTRPEPFGLVIVEAMACGRALVATPTGGAAELFVDGEHALATKSGDEEQLAVTLRRLIDDPILRAQLGERGRQHAVSAFSRPRFRAELNTALSQIRSATR